MSEITITGASGTIVTLQGGSDSNYTVLNKALSIQRAINTAIASEEATVYNLTYGDSEVKINKTNIGIDNVPGVLQVNHFNYIIVPDSDNASTTTNGLSDISISTQQNNNDNLDLTILSGRRSGLILTPGNNSGTVVNTTGNLYFDGGGKTGNWDIYTEDGNHTIRTGTGKNNIFVGAGTSSIYSEGQDNINVTGQINGTDPYTVAEITLAGGNSTVLAGKGGMVTDISSNNQITAYENTTVAAGTNGLINFWAAFAYPGNNTIQGGTGNTINSTDTNVTAIHGTNNTFEEVTENLNFLNGDGNTSATIAKQLIGFGANDLNFTLNYSSFDKVYDTSPDASDIDKPFTGSSLFVAGQGNETLNASGFHNKIEIYANTVSGAQSNFIATGGSGDDLFAAGTGNSTFTGGAGNNLFAFTKDVDGNGTTVITDFANQGSHNTIGLYNYGLNNDSLLQLINSSHNDDQGNAILNLENHTITIDGVSVADLKTSQFLT